MSASPKRFAVALSFPGEYRGFISEVAAKLADILGKERVLYDEYLTAEFARPNLDVYLASLYRNESDLLVPFFCIEYERKQWCGLEWRQMRDIIKEKEDERVMPFRLDDSPISGVLSIDGYVMVGARSPAEVAKLVLERVRAFRRDSTEDLRGLTSQEREQAGVYLLLLLSQAYYKLLEGAFGNGLCAVDLKLNDSYLWTVSNIANLLNNFSELSDFPEQFEPVVHDLFPSTIRDLEWDDLVSVHAEGFLAAVQRYVRTKRIPEPEEHSRAWIFVELFRPAVTSAIETAESYSTRMREQFNKLLSRVAKTPNTQEGPGNCALQRASVINIIAKLSHGEIDALAVAVGASYPPKAQEIG